MTDDASGLLPLKVEDTFREDPRQTAYAAHRKAWREAVAALEPYQHPDGSPVTPVVEDPLTRRAASNPKDAGFLGADA
jgi:hypothetical protein